MITRRTVSASILALAALSAERPARAWVVDFESVALDGEPFVTRPPRWVANAQSNDPVRVTFVAGAQLRVYDLFLYAGGPLRGRGLIDWDWRRQSNQAGTTLRFSRPVESVTLEAGDWGSDDDSPLELSAMDCNGAVLARTSVQWTIDRNPPFAILAVQARGICKVVYRSGGQYPGSTFIDNVRFE
ncbi:MAG: hypothetical protein JNK05_36445 [Myxococcales bacterium]|nr:hypothetical protein [Myxococcales bacterium]